MQNCSRERSDRLPAASLLLALPLFWTPMLVAVDATGMNALASIATEMDAASGRSPPPIPYRPSGVHPEGATRDPSWFGFLEFDWAGDVPGFGSWSGHPTRVAGTNADR